MSYSNLLPLLRKTGSSLTVEEFQSRINVVFHDHEAWHYDRMHLDMWESLQEQIDLLVGDLLSKETVGSNLSLLDVGCGTGLSTQQLLRTPLGAHISDITLLDTSTNMLKQAAAKAGSWGKRWKTVNAEIFDLDDRFDVIIVCSVLHHIPELDVFLKEIDKLLKPGGIFLHLQDPNGDYLTDPVYRQRVAEYEHYVSENVKQRWTDLFPKKWKNTLNRYLGRKNYIDRINDQLLQEKVIRRRMTADEIWSVTDIHVESKADNHEKGISLRFLTECLPNFTLIKQRSYAFFGVLKSDLPEILKAKEDNLIMKHELNGRNLSCVWIKKN